jgi:hypothetical protein
MLDRTDLMYRTVRVSLLALFDLLAPERSERDEREGTMPTEVVVPERCTRSREGSAGEGALPPVERGHCRGVEMTVEEQLSWR